MLEKICAELADVGRTAVASGLVQASGGNLSARLDDTTFVVTGAGTWLDRLTPRDFAVVDLDGNVASPDTEPSSEWKLHQRAYLRRPDVTAVVHVHPQHAVLLSALRRDIRLLTLDHAYYVKSVGYTEFHPNGSIELAETAAAQLADHNCVIMRHHGCTTVGDSIGMAYRRALNLEEAATATYRSLLLGDDTTTFPDEQFHQLHHA